MSGSLKAFIPNMARELGMTDAALYERQRALVRSGVLQGISGRGLGSGVRLTPKSVATLLISVLAAEHLNDVPAATKAAMGLRSQTGVTFGDAMTSILKGPTDYTTISFERETLRAEILGVNCQITFSGKQKKAPCLVRTAILGGQSVNRIAKALTPPPQSPSPEQEK